MNSKEFEQWFNNFTAAFPAVDGFVRRSSDPSGLQTKKLWFSVLEKRTLADCLAATIAMFDGHPEIPGADRGYPDWSQVPRIVSRWCADRKPVQPEWTKEAKRAADKKGIIESDPGMAAALEKAIEILDNGGTMTDVRAMLLQRFPDKGAPGRTPYHEDEYQET